MNARCTLVQSPRREAGYALLTVVFLAALMLIAAVVAAPNLLTEGRREKEEELIWRGGQYARAVRLYYRKNGRFPQSLEDLTKPKSQIRYLRKEYTDPMNSKDGSWRLIYVGPAGQLIGSVKHRGLLSAPGAAGPQGSSTQPGQPITPPGTDTGEGEERPTGAGRPPGAPAQPATSPAAPAGDALSGQLFGGNIIGVGSKINRRSLRIYDGGVTYREWEFIWDPAKEAVLAGQPAPPGSRPPGASPNPSPQPPNPFPRPQ